MSAGIRRICYAAWENGSICFKHRIFLKIKSCHDIGMLRPILWSLGTCSTPKVVGYGGVVADIHVCSTHDRAPVLSHHRTLELTARIPVFPEYSYPACGAPMPCGAGSSHTPSARVFISDPNRSTKHLKCSSTLLYFMHGLT